jgi:hypothetical protein
MELFDQAHKLFAPRGIEITIENEPRIRFAASFMKTFRLSDNVSQERVCEVLGGCAEQFVHSNSTWRQYNATGACNQFI